jgi:Protein of unknown function (DUF3553)
MTTGTSKRTWTIGDRVVHTGRPEWGVGEVRAAKGVIDAGDSSQLLTVRFERGGIKTLSTAIAELREPSQVALSENAPPPDAVTAALDATEIDRRFSTLPDLSTDPFKSRRLRLESSLGLYRFSGTGSSLLDWAAMQTGMKDPLSRFSRHDLEHQFQRFSHALDQHVRKLVQELKREDAQALSQVLSSAPPEAKRALRRYDTSR